MNCQECSESLLEYLEGDLAKEKSEQITKHLATCTSCSEEHADIAAVWDIAGSAPKPSASMRDTFAANLAAHKKEGEDVIIQPSTLARVWSHGYAQAAAITVAFLVGVIVTRSVPSGDRSDNRIETIEAELISLRQFTALSLLNQSSAAERLRGLEWIADSGIENTQTLNTLYDKLQYDPNINVRFAALGTLDVHADKSNVRGRLVELLESPNSPLIRAELIKLLVRHANLDSLPTLNRISQDSDENPTIRELARWSVETLEGRQDDEV